MVLPKIQKEYLLTLCPNLKPLLELELKLGNKVAFAEPSDWFNTDLLVTLEYRFHTLEIEKNIDLSNIEFVFHKSQKPYYGAIRFYRCKITGHIIQSKDEIKPTMTDEEMLQIHVKRLFNEK